MWYDCGMSYSTANCRRCGAVFARAGANHKFCSQACKRGTSTCTQCGGSFVPKAHTKALFCSPECHYEYKTPTGTAIKDASTGYMIVKVPPNTPGSKRRSGRTRWMPEHRYVMQQHLGRPLTKNENVHHIDGNRENNAIENLELWTRPQPTGVRVVHCAGCTCTTR